MPKTTPLRNNFNGGELSPKIDWREDVDKYHSGCVTMQNVIPIVEGGATRSPGTYFVAETKYSSKKSRLVPFRFSTEQAYIIEVGDQYLRFYKDKAQISVADVPVEIVTSFLEADIFNLKYTQSADVLYWFNKNYAPSKLSRLSHTDWTQQAIPFRPPPTGELGFSPDFTLTPSATTGDGVTFTSSGAAFLSGDVGRVIQFGTSRASIVSFTSTSIVVCDILDDFPDTNPIPAGDWTILSSPNGTISMDQIKVGEVCTLNSESVYGTTTDLLSVGDDNWLLSTEGTNEYYLSPASPFYSSTPPGSVLINGVDVAQGNLGSLGINQGDFGHSVDTFVDTIYIRLADGSDPDSNTPPNSYVQRSDGSITDLFRVEDVGKYIYVNGGSMKIITFISGTSVKCEVMQELSTADRTTVWALEEEAWVTGSDDYPAVGVFFEQRLVLGGSKSASQTINMSVSGDYENFSRDPDLDDASISYTLVSNQVEGIHWFAGTDFLMIGTLGGMWKFGATNSNEPISQLNISAKKQSGYSTRDMAPLLAAESILWVNLSGRTVNRLDYSFESDKYISTNMARIAGHITSGSSRTESGIIDMAFQQAPFPVVWAVRADGQLLGMTYETQENIYAWFRIVTDGAFESVAVISNSDEEDEVWVVVRRTVGGGTVRYVEYFTPIELFSEISNSFFVHAGVSYDGGEAVDITGITSASPAVVSAVNTFSDGDKVKILGVEGMTQANTGVLKAWTVANPTGTTFELSGIDSTVWDAYSSGGTAQVVKKDFTSGLSHLNGKTVDIVTDGAVHPQGTVGPGGTLSLGWYGNKVHVGLPAPAIVEPTKPRVDLSQGSSRGKKQRISSVLLSFYETYGCKIGPDLDNLKTVKFGTGGPPELFTGEKEQPFNGPWGRDASLVVKQDLPLPMTIRAISYGLSVNEE